MQQKLRTRYKQAKKEKYWISRKIRISKRHPEKQTLESVKTN